MKEGSPRPTSLKLLYLVPDLTDPAVGRRKNMLEAGGAHAFLAGFRRKRPPPDIAHAIDLGQTFDANLAQRARAVCRWLARPVRLGRLARGHDVIIARNLEMLLLATAAKFWSRERPKLIYEVLDIHTSLLGSGLKSRLLRGLEATLMRRVDSVIVSSPAFVSAYFERFHRRFPDPILLENKLLRLDDHAGSNLDAPSASRTPAPWRIGWFGMIRCRRSLELLSALAEALPGQVEVIIRGRPTPAVFPDFDAELSGRRGVRFEGPYSPDDLPRHYQEVDFVWAIDFYEEGLNSAWLLPNRLYEGGAFDRPAIAQAHVETGRWLQRRESGVVLSDPSKELKPFFSNLTPDGYDSLLAAARRVPRTDLICNRHDCISFVDALWT